MSSSGWSLDSLHEVYRRKVWDAKIPIQIIINENELLKLIPNGGEISFTNIKSRPFFAFLPRTTYFPFLFSQLQRHYDDVFTAIQEKMNNFTLWFEYEGSPLSWHYPVGHLFDEVTNWSSNSPVLPWRLTLRFTDYPSTLLPFSTSHTEEGGGSLGLHFYSMLKQSDYIRHGSSKLIMNLSKSEQVQLWDGIWTHSFEKFWKIMNKLVGAEGYMEWKNLPIRLYLEGKGMGRCILQTPISPNSVQTVEDVVRRLIPTELDAKGKSSLYSHGINIPLDTPIQWLMLYFTFPDGFVHLVLT